MRISIYNGAGQVDYMFGLVSGLAQYKEDQIKVLDVDEAKNLFDEYPNIKFIHVFDYLPKGSSLYKRGYNVIRFYLKQLWHLIKSPAGIVHFQWLDRKKFIDRVLFPTLARLRGNKVVFTVHNVNAGRRDNKNTWFNRITLNYLYRISNHLIVHTPASKAELISEFNIRESKISIIKHGINNRVSKKGINTAEARKQFGIEADEMVVLFFGNIDYYKGLDILIKSLDFTDENIHAKLKLLIAGNSKNENYTREILSEISNSSLKDKVISRIAYIPDDEIEAYFMAADCVVLPYRNIYQSGVVFMAYSFGLPILVTDIGNFRNDMIEEKTGLLIGEATPEKVAGVISGFLNSDMYKNMPQTRDAILKWAYENYSWESIGRETHKLYEQLINKH